MPIDLSIYPFDANQSREQQTQQPAGLRIKPASEELPHRALSHERTRLKSKGLPENEPRFSGPGEQPNPDQQNGRLRPSIRSPQFVIFLFFLILGALAHDSRAVLAQNRPAGRTPGTPKRILVLCSYGYSLPAYQQFNPAYPAVMVNAGLSTNDLFFEYTEKTTTMTGKPVPMFDWQQIQFGGAET